MAEYRIKRLTSGRYEVQKKTLWFFWERDGGDRRLKSQEKSTYYNYWYDTYEQAKRGAQVRMEFDAAAEKENGSICGKIFYYPFPEFED